MAYEIPFNSLSYPANIDLSSSQFLAVKLVTASGGVQGTGIGGAAVALSDGTTPALGIVQNNPGVGEATEITVLGVSKVVASGILAIGDLVYFDSAGKAIKAAGSSGKYAQAIALETAAVGDVTTVYLINNGIQ